MASQAALVSAVSTVFSAEYSVFAMFAFVSYDWLINLDKEIQYFWDYRQGRKLTAAGLLHGMSRYPAIIGMILEVQTAFPLSDTVCQINGHLQIAANIPSVLAPAMFSAVRIYALSPINKAVAVSIFLLLFMPTFTITIINAMEKSAAQPSPFNCSIVQTAVSQVVAKRLSLARGACGIAGDILVLFITWHNTYMSYKAQQGVLKGPSLVQVLLYNGSFYFIVITAMNVLNMLLIPATAAPGIVLANIANVANNPVTSVLICHFLFDLREAHRLAAPPSSPSALPSLHLRSTGGSLDGSPDALPAFIASMGSQVHTPGLRRVDPEWMAGDEDGILTSGEERARKQGAAQEDENDIGMPGTAEWGKSRESV